MYPQKFESSCPRVVPFEDLIYLWSLVLESKESMTDVRSECLMTALSGAHGIAGDGDEDDGDDADGYHEDDDYQDSDDCDDDDDYQESDDDDDYHDDDDFIDYQDDGDDDDGYGKDYDNYDSHALINPWQNSLASHSRLFPLDQRQGIVFPIFVVSKTSNNAGKASVGLPDDVLCQRFSRELGFAEDVEIRGQFWRFSWNETEVECRWLTINYVNWLLVKWLWLISRVVCADWVRLINRICFSRRRRHRHRHRHRHHDHHHHHRRHHHHHHHHHQLHRAKIITRAATFVGIYVAPDHYYYHFIIVMIILIIIFIISWSNFPTNVVGFTLHRHTLKGNYHFTKVMKVVKFGVTSPLVLPTKAFSPGARS